jgi:hypothetical protein
MPRMRRSVSQFPKIFIVVSPLTIADVNTPQLSVDWAATKELFAQPAGQRPLLHSESFCGVLRADACGVFLKQQQNVFEWNHSCRHVE